MPTVFVTGANRGLGLEFVRQYAAEGWRVLAACRDPEGADDLRRVDGEVFVHRLDVTDDADIEALQAALADEAIDVLINNAGIGGVGDGNPIRTGITAMDKADPAGWAQAFRVNSIAPFLVTCALLRQVLSGTQRKVVTVSSTLGSIGDNTSGGQYAYRSSKSAVNMVVRNLAHDLTDRGVICVAVNPGWVRTRMGGPSAPKSPEESIAALRRLIDGLTTDDTGRFYNHDGSAIPW
jgi:NAD(P)-dependent dehydrogenase (short-subunit alcohol dehydrogenase family)